MSVRTKNPQYLAGANFTSGGPNTGEIHHTRGGQRNGTVWSGALAMSLVGLPTGALGSGNNAQVWSGPGRLHTIIPHQYLNSGQPVWFYDAGAITVSGISVSGQRIIGYVPLTMPAALAVLSGNTQLTLAWDQRIVVDMPFTSGLCISAASGSPGCSFSFSTERLVSGASEPT